jgi:hypothetical protein
VRRPANGLWILSSVSKGGPHGVMAGYLRAEEIGKRLDSWAMARGDLGVVDGRERYCRLGSRLLFTIGGVMWWGGKR